jgi:hypothetical protein
MPPGPSVKGKTLKAKPANAFGEYDSVPFALVDINRATKEELIKYLRIRPKVADGLISLRQQKPISEIKLLSLVKGLSGRLYSRIKQRVIVAGEPSPCILDVASQQDYIYSHKPFILTIRFANPSEKRIAIASVTVLWAGKPFVVEKELTEEESHQGRVHLEFDEQRTLPIGPAEFLVALYRPDGTQASFRKTFYVLPVNPLSLSLSPAGATVTGTWSAHGEYRSSSDTFLTECTMTIANGDTNSVRMNRRVAWKFWDGGIGATLVESGAFDWPGNISVLGNSVWQGGIWFSSPNGSGIYNKYRGKEDMTIEIQMSADDGRSVAGTITCRVMLAYGVNIIKVGNFDFQEGVDLYHAVDVTRQIYERRDITFRAIFRWMIHNANAGGYTVINSEQEVHDLFQDWSVQNDSIDIFVCQDFVGTSFDGLAGDIPGPASKGGSNDGVAADKTGFTDASEVKRLDIRYLGMLIGHELGHYLGLPHINETGNLMLSNSGTNDTNLNYEQYRLILPHGFLVFT